VIWDQPALASTDYDYDSIMHYAPTRAAKRSSDCKKVTYDGKEDCLAFLPNQEKLDQQRQTLGSTIKPGQRDHLSAGDIARVNALYPASSPAASPAPPRSQKSITETTPVRPLCCRDREGGGPFCRPAACPAVRVRWPRPDRWCRPEWCRPSPRRYCDGWFEARRERPPFDDWDDRW
jgi:hypothetical protein